MRDINLLPEEVNPNLVSKPVSNIPIEGKKAFTGISPKVLVLSVVIVAILCAGLIIPNLYIKKIDSQISSTEKSLSETKYVEINSINTQIASVTSQIAAKSDVISSIDNSSFPMEDLLNSVSEAAPKGCMINSVRFSQGTMAIEGVAADSITATEFVNNVNRLSFIAMDSQNDIQIEKSGNIGYSFQYKFNILGKGVK